MLRRHILTIYFLLNFSFCIGQFFFTDSIDYILKPSFYNKYLEIKDSLFITPDEFISNYSSKIIGNSKSKLLYVRTKTDPSGNIHKTYQQYYNNYPINDGYVILHCINSYVNKVTGSLYYNFTASSNMTHTIKPKNLIKNMVPKNIMKDKRTSIEYKCKYIDCDTTPFKKEMILSHEITVYSDTNNYDYTFYFFASNDKYLFKNKNTKYCAPNYYTPTSDETVENCANINFYNTDKQFFADYEVSKAAYLSKIKGNRPMLNDFNRTIYNNINVVNGGQFITSPTLFQWNSPVQRGAATYLWAAEFFYDYAYDNYGFSTVDNKDGNISIVLNSSVSAGILASYSNKVVNIVGVNVIRPAVLWHELGHSIADQIWGNGTVVIGEYPFFEGIADITSMVIQYAYTGGNVLWESVYNPSWSVNATIGDVDWNNPHRNEDAQKRIITHWFYIMCNGQTGFNTLGYPYNVSGIGINKADKILFHAMEYYSYQGISLKDALVNCLLSAADLYGNCSNEYIQTSNAIEAVGIRNGTTNWGSDYNLCLDINSSISSQFIFATGVFTLSNNCSTIVRNNSTLIANSSTKVVLKPGFKAERGSFFHAGITQCYNPTVSKTPPIYNSSRKEYIETSHLNKIVAKKYIPDVFPNPFENTFNIDYNPDSISNNSNFYRIIDINSKTIKEGAFNVGSNQVDMSSVGTGLYYLQLYLSGTYSKTFKIVRK
ncbi:MAG: M4 family metallopeptidase [Cytophagales bacterium]|nr:M4 family metallopeptidase [Cytophagales bacterium]